MTKEEQIKSYMEKLDLTEAEAIQLWEDDHEDFIGEDGEQMEQKAKELKRHYEKGEVKKRKPSTKERKVDEDKKFLLGLFAEVLATNEIKVDSIKTETEISFQFNESDYTLKLTKHRKKK